MDLEVIRASIMAQMGHIESARCRNRMRPCAVCGCPKVDQNMRDRVHLANSVDDLRNAVSQLVCWHTYFEHCFESPSPERLEYANVVLI